MSPVIFGGRHQVNKREVLAHKPQTHRHAGHAEIWGGKAGPFLGAREGRYGAVHMRNHPRETPHGKVVVVTAATRTKYDVHCCTIYEHV